MDEIARERFQRTLLYLQMSYDDLHDSDVSDDEASARTRLIELCRAIVRAADTNEPRQRLHTFID